MNAQIAFRLALDREHGNEHNQPLGIGKLGPSTSISRRMREVGGLKEFLEVTERFLDPLGVELRSRFPETVLLFDNV